MPGAGCHDASPFVTRLQPGDVVGDAALDPVLRPVAGVPVDAGDVEVAVAARAVRVAPGQQVDRGAGRAAAIAAATSRFLVARPSATF
jgi:hypothetical protein